MELESLANELLVDLFEFLDGTDILRAFHGLNSRFDSLLFVHFRAYHLNFQSISKREFDLIRTQQLPLILDRIISLRFSDDEVTPNLPNLLFSNGLTLNQFTHLQSLSIVHINCKESIETMLQECSYSSHLTHLSMSECSFPIYNDLSWLTNEIWRLPQLRHFSLSMCSSYPVYHLQHSVISVTIENVVLNNVLLAASELSNILRYTPRLRHLDVGVFWNYNELLHPSQLHTTLSVTALKITSAASLGMTMQILRSMHILRHLTIDLTHPTDNDFFNGHNWKQFIITHLSKIKTFRLRMIGSFRWYDRKRKIDELLNTFRTPFWFDQHRWFVRCEYGTRIKDECVTLYTLPYCFEKYHDLHEWISFKSTCPDDGDYWSYDNVREVSNVSKDFNWSLFPIRFPNIARLLIQLPNNEDIWHIFPTLDHLISLHVRQFDDTAEDQLCSMINQASHLYSLIVEGPTTLSIMSSKITNTSIRRVEWRDSVDMCESYFTHEECTMWTVSSLGRQCEILTIPVEKATDILDLIKTMSNLRSLICRCRDDEGYYNDDVNFIPCSSPSLGEFVPWLQNHLPSTFSIRRKNRFIQLWIVQEN